MKAAVLVVDDSLTVRMHLTELLTEAGLTVVGCADLREARQQIAQGAFPLVILDVMLPDGDGIDLLRDIRAAPTLRDCAVMLLSSEADVSERVRGLSSGADEYVGKPYDAGYVVARARELIGQRMGSSAQPRDAILIIEQGLALATKLRGTDLEVIAAESGEEGLRLAAHARPAAVVVDEELPGIDGATVIRRIRLDAALRSLPCLLLVRSDDREHELNALEAGADAFVRNDEDIAVIQARLNAMLRSAARAQTQATASLQSPKRILLAHDDESDARYIASALRAEGYELALSRSGEGVLELLALQPVDCILLAFATDKAQRLAICRRLKAALETRDIPVIMLAPIEDSRDLIEGLEAGADDHIVMAEGFELLRARVLAQIRRKQFEDENRSVREQTLRAEMKALEARAAREMAETRAALVDELKAKNEELESFSYSVAHDLRAPLRSIDGFGLALLEDYGEKVDEEGRQYIQYVRESAQQMAGLIDDLLALSRVTRGDLARDFVDLGAVARETADRLARAHPDRVVDLVIPDGLHADCDRKLLAIVFENLIGNAWKFTAARPQARIEVGADSGDPQTFFVRDNGAGFDMAYYGKLFGVFQRLHSSREFEGTGIGLATVQRVIRRHGGRIWGEGAVGQGATFFFTLAGARELSDAEACEDLQPMRRAAS